MSLDRDELARCQRRQAANRRWHPDRPELVADDQRALKAAALERHIRKALTDPTPAQPERDRLALLLLRGDGDPS